MPTTFISEYLRHTEIYESPTSFWRWSAYATIAAVLRDNCYLKQGDSKLYTNIYVLFLAESSGHRKGKPVDLSETLVNKIKNTKIISGRTSVQAILDELARVETDKLTGKMTKAGSAIFYAQELSAGIVEDPSAVGILTDIYDYKNNPYKSRLRTGPCFNLERIVLSMLAASNEAMLRGFFDATAVQGGLLARTFLVTPNNEFRKPNSLMRVKSDERTASGNRVLEKLVEISQLQGEFILEEEAIVEYETWYDPFRASYLSKKESSGIVGRIHTSVIKLALILAANDNTLHVKKVHIEEAIDVCVGLIPNYSVFTMSNGRSEVSKAAGLVLTDLLVAKGNILPRKIIQRSHWQDGLDNDMFDKVIGTLESAGMIVQHSTKDGLLLGLTDTALKMMLGEQGKKGATTVQ